MVNHMIGCMTSLIWGLFRLDLCNGGGLCEGVGPNAEIFVYGPKGTALEGYHCTCIQYW